MQEIVFFEEGLKQLLPGGEASQPRGKMKMEPGKICYGLVAKFEFPVTSTGNAQLNAAQRLTVLSALTFSFKPSLSLTEKINTYEGNSLLVIRDDCKRLLGRDYEGVDDTTTGLGTSFTGAQTKTLSLTVYLPLAYATAIEEARKIMGLGYNQLLDSSALLKFGADPFKAATSGALTVSNPTVTFGPLWEKGHRRFIGVPLVFEEKVNAGSKVIETDPGFILSCEQMTPLADEDLGLLTVQVGKPGSDYVQTTAAEATADAIQVQYERGGVGSPASTVKSNRTLLRAIGPTAVGNIQAGRVKVLKTGSEEWKLRVVRLPYLTTQQVMDLVKAEASTLPPGKQLVAVCAATYDGVDINPEQYGMSGFVCFESDEAEFNEYSGWRCGPTGNPWVEVVETKLRQFGRRVVDAMQPTRRYPKGNPGAVAVVKADAGWGIPALYVNEDGPKYVSTVADTVSGKVDEAAAEAEQQTNQAREAMETLQAMQARADAARKKDEKKKPKAA
jgi:hypothetical protein